MNRHNGHISRSIATALRRLLRALLIIAYVAVGIGGEISCAEEALANGALVEVTTSPGKDDQGSKKATTVADHCYTCAPILVPPPVLVAEPAAHAAKLLFVTPSVRLEDGPGLETPPPKRLS